MNVLHGFVAIHGPREIIPLMSRLAVKKIKAGDSRSGRRGLSPTLPRALPPVIGKGVDTMDKSFPGLSRESPSIQS